MPRRARQERDGPCHHVIIKGHNGEPIVSSDEDRAELALAISSRLAKVGLQVLGWAILTTHAHFFISGPIDAIAKALHDALGPYAFRWNAKQARSGRVFNDRYWSRPVHDDDDAVNLVLYVTLNPLKAGIVQTREELEFHRWCSLGAVVRNDPAIISVDANAVLAFFGPDPDIARRVLRECVDQRIEQWREDCEMRSLPAIIRVVAARHGLPPETLTDGTGGRWFVSARREVVVEARARGYSYIAIAKALNLSRSNVYRLAG